MIRGHYGRYHDPLYGGVYTYTQPNAHSQHTFYQIVDGRPVELFHYVEEVNLPGPRRSKRRMSISLSPGWSAPLVRTQRCRSSTLGRRFANFIGWVDRRLDDWIPYDVRDPGRTACLAPPTMAGTVTVYQSYGSAADVSDRALELGNPDGAYRRYDALQLIGTRRFADNWQYQRRYTWSRSLGNAGNEDHANATYSSMNPGDTVPIPMRAWRRLHRRCYDYSEFKALGSYRAPWLGGFTVAGVFRWHNGTNWNRIAQVRTPIFASFPTEPLGARRTPSLANLDLRAEKTFSLQKGTTLGLYVDGFNLTNQGRATSFNPMSGPSFGRRRGGPTRAACG